MPTQVPPFGDEFRRENAHFANLKVTAQEIPDLTVRISEGSFWFNEETYVEYSGGSSAALTPPPGSAKWVVVAMTQFGTIDLIDGAVAASPTLPDLPPNRLPLAGIFIQALDTLVSNDMIFDLRPIYNLGARVGSVTVAEVTGLQAELDSKAGTVDLNNAIATRAATDGTIDPDFLLNSDQTGVPGDNASIGVERGSENNVYIRWNESTEIWEYTNDGTNYDTLGNASAVGALDTRVSQNEADIAVLQTIGGGSGAAAIAALQVDVSNLQIADTNFASQIGALQSADTTHDTDIATNASNIAANASAISTIQGDLTTLTADTDVNASNITAIAAVNDTQDTNILNLQNDVTDAEAELAERLREIGVNMADLDGIIRIVTDGLSYNARSDVQVPSPVAEDHFGSSVGMSGDGRTFGIAASRHDGVFDKAGTIFVFVRDGHGWVLQQTLNHADTQVSDFTAAHNSLRFTEDGNRLIYGVPMQYAELPPNPFDRFSGDESGKAKIWDRDSAGVWTETQTLVPSDLNVGNDLLQEVKGDVAGFHADISRDGNTAVVCSPFHYTSGLPYAGAAYIFVRNPDTNVWTEQAKLTASDAAAGMHFAYQTSISGDGDEVVLSTDYLGERLPVTASSYPIIAANSVSSTFTIAGVHVDDFINGRTLDVVGSTGNDGAYVVNGAYEDTGNTVIPTVQPVVSDVADGTINAVAVFGTPTEAAYIFRRTGTSWAEVQKLTSPDTLSPIFGAERFGVNVGMSRDKSIVAVGTNRAHNASALTTGAIDVFLLNASSLLYEHQQRVFGSFPYGAHNLMRFGHCVSLSSDGKYLSAGAHSEQAPVPGVNYTNGAVYVFEKQNPSGSAMFVEIQRLDNADFAVGGLSDGQRFGVRQAMSSDGRSIAVGAPYYDTLNISGSAVLDSGHGFVFDKLLSP